MFLPILLLRALIPVGFMPMVGPHFSVQLVVCDGDGPTAASMSMDMPAGMPMHGVMGASGFPDHHPTHDNRGTCPYGSAPVLGALPAHAILPALEIRRSPESPIATAQVAYVEVSPRAQSPRGPPA